MRKELTMRKSALGGWLALLVGAALLSVLGGWLAVASLTQATFHPLGIESKTVAPGGTVTVNVTSVALAPGIGAYTIDVVYDGTKISATACTSAAGPCNTAFATNTTVNPSRPMRSAARVEPWATRSPFERR